MKITLTAKHSKLYGIRHGGEPIIFIQRKMDGNCLFHSLVASKKNQHDRCKLPQFRYPSFLSNDIQNQQISFTYIVYHFNWYNFVIILNWIPDYVLRPGF